jgi:3-dehydroquinate synthase
MDPVIVPVASASGGYVVRIAPGSAAGLAPLLAQAGITGRTFLVSSPIVWKLHEETLARALPAAERVLVPDGERFKNLATVGRIYEALIRAEADRGCAVIAVGGGVIGDMAGFAAATYLRGVALAQVPTTLLAQVDSAIGGKVGVNHTLGKNLIGAFHPPRIVVADPRLLETLPRREFRAGLYEVLKYGVIARRELFERVAAGLTPLFGREPGLLTEIIAESCRIKADIVGHDEREAGLRRLLNFGHTIGHAIEATTRYRRFRHGEAIAFGMLAAAEIGVSRGTFPQADRDALRNTIVQMGPLPPVGDLSARQALEAVRRDKKVLAGRLHFVLPTAIGRAAVVDDVTEKELARAMRTIGMKD